MKACYRAIVAALAGLSVGLPLAISWSAGEGFEASNVAAWRLVAWLPALTAIWVALALVLLLGLLGVFTESDPNTPQDHSPGGE